MRTYSQTHPWITFQLDLGDVHYQLWLLLGEAQANCEAISGAPLLPEVASELHQIYLAKGVLATTAIEGNTLTEAEVRQQLQGKLKLPPSKQYLGQEINNIVTACNQIAETILSGQPNLFTLEDIKNFNRLALAKLPLDEGVISGEIRAYQVTVGRYRGAPPEDCAYLLEKLVTWLNYEFKAPSDEHTIVFGVLKAIIAHLYLAWIHPFGDGNGRTARLLELQILLSSSVPSAAVQLLSNHYNQTRTEYYRQLDQTSNARGNVIPFIHYAVQGFVDGLKAQLEVIRAQQLDVHWINYVHALFRDKDHQTDLRRRRLALDLLQQREAIPFSKIRHLSPRIAEGYAGKTDKTIQRDLEELEQMNLIVRSAQGVRVKREVVSAFLPGSRFTV